MDWWVRVDIKVNDNNNCKEYKRLLEAKLGEVIFSNNILDKMTGRCNYWTYVKINKN